MATTIASYNVAFALQPGVFVDKAKLLRDEVAALKGTLNSLKTPAEQYTTHITNLETALKKGAITQDDYNRKIGDLKTKFAQADPPIVKVNNSLWTMATRMRSLIAVYGVFTALRSSVSSALDAEKTQLQFEVLLQSGEKAKTLLSDMRKFAAESPLGFTDITEAGKKLMQVGVDAKNVIPIMSRLSDISLGNKESFASLALAYSQVISADKLMGQEKLQLINAGFNPLAQIARDMASEFGGLASSYMPRLVKAMEAGQISADMFEGSIINATSAGGLFGGMSEKISTSMGTQFDKAIDQLQQLSIQLGEKLAPLLIDMLDGFEQNKSMLQDMVWVAGEFVSMLRIALALVRDTSKFYGTITRSVIDFGRGGGMAAVATRLPDLIESGTLSATRKQMSRVTGITDPMAKTEKKPQVATIDPEQQRRTIELQREYVKQLTKQNEILKASLSAQKETKLAVKQLRPVERVR